MRCKPKQYTWCYCPGCKRDLCSMEPSPFVEDAELVVYRCTNCGTESRWDFDTYPCPVTVP